jgi:hypothetical protein
MIPFVMLNLDRPRKLRFGMGALIEFEQVTGIKAAEFDEENMSFDLMGKVLWLLLKQEDKDLTLEGTYALVDEYAANLTVVMEAVSQAIDGAFNTGEPKNAPPATKKKTSR